MHSYQSQLNRTAQAQPLSGIHVLLVEDEIDVATLLVFVLEAAGSTVKLCNDAEAALSAVEIFQPDIIVSNIKLPSQDGAWLIEQIRNHSHPEIQSIPAIAVTSYERDVCVSCLLDSGFDSFLSKLDPPDAIVEVIATLVPTRHTRR